MGPERYRNPAIGVAAHVNAPLSKKNKEGE
jgi:hypothetical protein